MIVATKAGRYGHTEFDFSADRTRRSIEESLRLLGTDYVDIFQLHDVDWVDLEGPLGEGYEELIRLRAAGLCRFIGMTGYATAMTQRVITDCDLDVTLSFAHCTLLDDCLATEILPVAKERGVGVINASAVALGLLTEGGPLPYFASGFGEEICAAARRAVDACRDHGADISFLANQYCIQRSGCATTLIGTAKERHVESAVRAAEEPIDEGLLAAVLDAISSVRGRHWTPWPPQMS